MAKGFGKQPTVERKSKRIPHKVTGSGINLNVQGTVRVLHVENGRITTLNDNDTLLRKMEELSEFDIDKWKELCYSKDGFYFIDHYTRRSNYLGTTMEDVASELRVRGLLRPSARDTLLHLVIPEVPDYETSNAL